MLGKTKGDNPEYTKTEREGKKNSIQLQGAYRGREGGSHKKKKEKKKKNNKPLTFYSFRGPWEGRDKGGSPPQLSWSGGRDQK